MSGFAYEGVTWAHMAALQYVRILRTLNCLGLGLGSYILDNKMPGNCSLPAAFGVARCS